MTRALVTQLVEVLDRMDGWLKVRHLSGLMPDEIALTKEAREYLATEPSGERAELIAELKSACIDGTLNAKLVSKAADILEADADLRTQLARRTVERNMAISMAISMLEADAQQANKPTGWDNGLSQDYCAEFGKWLASRPGARQQIKEVFDEPEEEDLYALALKADNWGQP